MGHKSLKSSQVRFHAVHLGSAGHHAQRGTKCTLSFWLTFRDQNECCIGSVTKTLKAMETVLDDMTPKYSLDFTPQK